MIENRLENTNRTRAIGYQGGETEHPDYITSPIEEVKTAKEAYYRWLSRLVILLATLSLAFFASASLVLFKLVPQVTVEPFLFISQSRSEDIVRYEPVMSEMASSRQIMEMFIRQYVITRNVILDDELEMQSRWFAGGLVNYLSSPAVFTEFESKEVKVNLPLYARNHLVRDVEINSLTREGGEKSRAWRVKFTTYDISSQTREAGGGRVIVRHWTASLQAVFVPERMFLSRRLINPLGFTVIHYSQSEER